jgi:hypothetical protein
MKHFQCRNSPPTRSSRRGSRFPQAKAQCLGFWFLETLRLRKILWHGLDLAYGEGYFFICGCKTALTKDRLKGIAGRPQKSFILCSDCTSVSVRCES